MLIRVERGKGGRYRNAMLSPDLLTLLRAWWKEGRRLGAMLPGGWLFPGQNPVRPISTRQLSRVVEEAARAAGITARQPAYAAPQLRDASARRWRRYPRDPGAPRPREAFGKKQRRKARFHVYQTTRPNCSSLRMALRVRPASS
jgi:integrase